MLTGQIFDDEGVCWFFSLEANSADDDDAVETQSQQSDDPNADTEHAAVDELTE